MTQRICYIDADTLLYSSAASIEIKKCLATNTLIGKSKMFESKSAFNEWHATNSIHPKEIYTFEVEQELIGEVSHACHTVKQKIQNVTMVAEEAGFDDFRVCIQGAGNFRKDYQSTFVDYKGQRTEKPLALAQVKEFVKKKYKERCIVVDGEETDDFICYTAWKDYNPEIDVSSAKSLFAYCDKDIVQNSPGMVLNYNRVLEGIFHNTVPMQYKGFWGSVLTGDTADNIPGIIELGEATRKRYGIKTKGCGKVAAGRILSTIGSEQEAAQRVVEAYKDSWPEDYKERLADMTFFLWLRREPGQMFVLGEYLDKLNVNF